MNLSDLQHLKSKTTDLTYDRFFHAKPAKFFHAKLAKGYYFFSAFLACFFLCVLCENFRVVFFHAKLVEDFLVMGQNGG